MAGPDQDRRNAYAAEHGYDSYDEFRNAVDDKRAYMEQHFDRELTAYQARDLLDFQHNVDVENIAPPGEKREALLDAWHSTFGTDRDDEFYEWLHSYYEQMAG